MIKDHDYINIKTGGAKKPHESSNVWKESLSRLMKDFCFSQNIITKIITETEQELLPGESCARAYQKGWQKFRNTFIDM